MATYTLEQKESIIVNKPNKELLAYANAQRTLNMQQIYGTDLKSAIEQCAFHENDSIFAERSKYAISNCDLFKRLLGDESQVFTTRGGSALYNMPSKDAEAKINAVMADVRQGWSMHKWVQNFANPAYKADPMGLIYIEVTTDGKTPYPTYKSSGDICDYSPNGRNLDYVAFTLSEEEQRQFGIAKPVPPNTSNVPLVSNATYYRFVDGESDTLYMLNDGKLQEPPMLPGYPTSIPNKWKQVPGFIISDRQLFHKPRCFDSPVSDIMELSRIFMRDRSVRDLQKLYFGFAKAYEPLLPCPVCIQGGAEKGEGFFNGKTCPSCTPPGYEKGTGWKTKTRIGDVAKFPIAMFSSLPHLKVADLFGYVTPDIAGWDKQDLSIEAQEEVMRNTYWNTTSTQVQGFNGSQGTDETATKTLTNLQPKYATLNTLADWGEKTESMAADLICKYYYENAPGSSIHYSRDYILETPEEVFECYQMMRKGGSPDTALNDQFIKYLKCLYMSDPIAMAKSVKLFEVEPFPHRTSMEVELSTVIPTEDKIAKAYFGEWEDTLDEAAIINTDVKELRKQLSTYIQPKLTQIKKQQNDERKASAGTVGK